MSLPDSQNSTQAPLSPPPAVEGDPFLAANELAPSRGYILWKIYSLWPLALHAILVVLIVCFIRLYVHDNLFNIDNRRPSVTLFNGVIVQWVGYAPLQSDITTLLSALLTILRLVTTSWLGPLGWRCAFILLETTSLTIGQLYAIVSYGIPAVPQHRRTISIPILVILTAALPVHVIAPIITGSITWIPSNHYPVRLTDDLLRIPNATPGYLDRLPDSDERGSWDETASRISLLSFLAWGRDTRPGVMRRIVRATAGLPLNSTLANITLPYFSVTALEWVQDPSSTLTLDQLSVEQVACPMMTLTIGPCPLGRAASLGLIHDMEWLNRSITTPSLISERRLLALSVGSPWPNGTCRSTVELSQGGQLGHPSNSASYLEPNGPSGNCWKFAWVTYTAGASTCRDCAVSSYITVQNNTALAPEADELTIAALRMIPTVVNEMLLTNLTTGDLLWGTTDDHIVGILKRSYTSTWMHLHESTIQEPRYTNYSLSFPALRASVSSSRLYTWLVLQSLVTITGVLFFYVQLISRSPMIPNTALAPLFVNAQSVHKPGCYDRIRGGAPRKLEYEGDRMKVKID